MSVIGRVQQVLTRLRRIQGAGFTESTDSHRALRAALDAVDGLHDAPASDALANARMRDILGNKADAKAAASSATASAMAYLKALVDRASGGLSEEDRAYLNLERPLGIHDHFSWGKDGDDVTTANFKPLTHMGSQMWEQLLKGTGFVRIKRGETGAPTCLELNVNANNDHGSILAERSCSLTVDDVGVATVVFEGRCQLSHTSSLSVLLGFSGASRQGNPTYWPVTTGVFALFYWNGASFVSTTGDGAAKEQRTISGVTVTHWNTYKIEWTSASVKFYVGGTLKATHSARVPHVPLWPAIGARNDSGGAGRLLRLDWIRAYPLST